MANIYKRGKTWWGRVTKNGKEHRRSLDTTVKSVAQDRLQRWIEELRATSWGEQPRRLFDEAAKRFAEEHFTIIKPSSAKRYCVSLVNLAAFFEGKQLDDIGGAALLEFEMSRRKAGVTTATIRRDLQCLSSLFSCCNEWEWIDRNPVPLFLKKRAKKGLTEGEPRTRYLDHTEEFKLLEVTQSHVMLYTAIAFAIDTGLRKTEQLSLEWHQVDFEKREVSPFGKGGKYRTLPLLPRALSLLATLPRPPHDLPEQYVFWHDEGERYFDLYPALQKALKRAGIKEHCEWHDLRRTCGCRLLQDHCMPMERVSKWLGHSSVRVTERHYAFLNVRHLHESIRHTAPTGKVPAQNPAQPNLKVALQDS